MTKLISIISISLLSGFAGYLLFSIQDPAFEKLSPEAMYQKITQERDYAINQAVARGEYRCCINPPCTMCYLAANQWNGFRAGACACDDLIAQGKEPCPQCQRGLCQDCKLSDEIDEASKAINKTD